MEKILGLDLGSRTCGVAISDTLGMLAHGVETYHFSENAYKKCAYHIKNIVEPVSKGPHAKQVIFLSADAFGVLPPVSILNAEQTKYYFLSGFTAKLAGTERLSLIHI